MTAPEQQEPPLEALGAACAIALASALCAALPTSLRVASEGSSPLSGLLGGAALLLGLSLPAALLAPRVARGYRGLMGVRGALLATLALWASVTMLVLALAAAWLKAHTHHRGLGGAAFAIVALAGAGGAAVVVARLRTALLGAKAEGRRAAIARAGGAVTAALALAVVAWPLVAGGDDGADAARARALVFDVLLAIAAFAGFQTRALPRLGRVLRLAAVPLCVMVVSSGAWFVETGPSLAQAMRSGGGLPAALLTALESWTDRDGDGYGAHFGGGDCDEGDPRRHPAAEDRAGDGHDANCDGVDPPAEPSRPAPSAGGDTIPARAERAPQKPDLVLVTLDTVRADRTSAYGYDKDTTPALRALAGRGLRFEHAYAIGTDTQRAIVPLVSGRPLSRTPHSNVQWPLIHPEVDTLAERLKRTGYATGAVTSFTWLRRDRGFDQGFDRFDESPFREQHPERKVTGERALAAAKEVYGALAARPEPLFLWLHLFDAHARYVEHAGIDFGRDAKGLYDGEIAFVDRQLAALLALIEAGPRAARTVIVVHGSHGEAFGEHGKDGHGLELHEEVVHVPLVVAGAGVTAGRFDAGTVCTLDLVPTLLALADAPAEGTEGVSLAPALVGSPLERPPVVAHARRRSAVVAWPLKLLTFRRTGKPDRALLFDLQADPEESHDLSQSRGEDLARLLAALETSAGEAEDALATGD